VTSEPNATVRSVRALDTLLGELETKKAGLETGKLPVAAHVVQVEIESLERALDRVSR
jgi:hypothetical protein